MVRASNSSSSSSSSSNRSAARTQGEDSTATDVGKPGKRKRQAQQEATLGSTAISTATARNGVLIGVASSQHGTALLHTAAAEPLMSGRSSAIMGKATPAAAVHTLRNTATTGAAASLKAQGDATGEVATHRSTQDVNSGSNASSSGSNGRAHSISNIASSATSTAAVASSAPAQAAAVNSSSSTSSAQQQGTNMLARKRFKNCAAADSIGGAAESDAPGTVLPTTLAPGTATATTATVAHTGLAVLSEESASSERLERTGDSSSSSASSRAPSTVRYNFDDVAGKWQPEGNTLPPILSFSEYLLSTGSTTAAATGDAPLLVPATSLVPAAATPVHRSETNANASATNERSSLGLSLQLSHNNSSSSGAGGSLADKRAAVPADAAAAAAFTAAARSSTVGAVIGDGVVRHSSLRTGSGSVYGGVTCGPAGSGNTDVWQPAQCPTWSLDTPLTAPVAEVAAAAATAAREDPYRVYTSESASTPAAIASTGTWRSGDLESTVPGQQQQQQQYSTAATSPVQAVSGGSSEDLQLASSGSSSASSMSATGTGTTGGTQPHSHSSMVGSTDSSSTEATVQARVSSTTETTAAAAVAAAAAATAAAAAATAAAMTAVRRCQKSWDRKLLNAVTPFLGNAEMLDADGLLVLSEWARYRPTLTVEELHKKWHILNNCWEGGLLDEPL
jgi:trimeric autotransporter adhesin